MPKAESFLFKTQITAEIRLKTESAQSNLEGRHGLVIMTHKRCFFLKLSGERWLKWTELSLCVSLAHFWFRHSSFEANQKINFIRRDGAFFCDSINHETYFWHQWGYFLQKTLSNSIDLSGKIGIRRFVWEISPGWWRNFEGVGLQNNCKVYTCQQNNAFFYWKAESFLDSEDQ